MPWSGLPSHQCLSAGGLIQTAPREYEPLMTFAGHQCLSAGGLIQTRLACAWDAWDAVKSPMPFGWGANPNKRYARMTAAMSLRHQCLSAGGLIQTRHGGSATPSRQKPQSPMPFGWGANPNRYTPLQNRDAFGLSPMPFGWGANPNPWTPPKTRPDPRPSPMPFGWGANPNARRHPGPVFGDRPVTNAFRLGG